jgi:hypothetical protein
MSPTRETVVKTSHQLVFDLSLGTPVALRAPSVPTALTYGDESTLKSTVFCLDNG